MQLTAMDVQHLIENPSGVAIGELAQKIAVAFSSGSFNLNETAVASDIFRLLLDDAEKSVRLTLAEYLYDNTNVPHDVIFKLACDEADIAGRVLQYSPILTDDDLISIIKSTKEVLNLCAIARRDNVSEVLSDMLISTQQEAVLNDLFNNNGAELSQNGLIGAWSVISSSNLLLETLVKRGGLPLTIAEKIFSVVSDELRHHISNEYKISQPLVQKYYVDAREWGLLGILPTEDITHPDDDESVEDLVNQLYDTGRLTYSLVIRALCMGFLNLFEASLARLSDVPRSNARILLMGGNEGFAALYKSSKMPESFAEAVEILLEISHNITQYGYEKPDDFRKRLIESIYVEGYHRSVDGMGYLLSIIDGKISGNSSSSSIH